MSLDELLRTMPELPEQATERLLRDYDGLKEDVAMVISSDPAAIQLYETAIQVALQELEGRKKGKVSIPRSEERLGER